MNRHLARVACLALVAGVCAAPSAISQAQSRSFLDDLNTNRESMATTLATNCDTNPYGVTLVPDGFPGGSLLHPGDILVSNFNNGTGTPPVCNGGPQATGTTIVRVGQNLKTTTFFTSPAGGPVGLTMALVALRSGLVVVGNTPRVDTATPTVADGGLTFLDGDGNIVLSLADPVLLQGPWGMTADDSDPDDPILYVSNVLSGTVTRLNLHVDPCGSGPPAPKVKSRTQIASGFAHTTNPAALVVGPTGLLLSHDGKDLYVAATADNEIQLVQGARDTQTDLGMGQTVFSGDDLNGPLSLAWTPRGTILTANGDAILGSPPPPPPINLVIEFDPVLQAFVAEQPLDSGALGALFGIAVDEFRGKDSLIYVDDNSNTVNVIPAKK